MAELRQHERADAADDDQHRRQDRKEAERAQHNEIEPRAEIRRAFDVSPIGVDAYRIRLQQRLDPHQRLVHGFGVGQTHAK